MLSDEIWVAQSLAFSMGYTGKILVGPSEPILILNFATVDNASGQGWDHHHSFKAERWDPSKEYGLKGRNCVTQRWINHDFRKSSQCQPSDNVDVVVSDFREWKCRWDCRLALGLLFFREVSTFRLKWIRLKWMSTLRTVQRHWLPPIAALSLL